MLVLFFFLALPHSKFCQKLKYFIPVCYSRRRVWDAPVQDLTSISFISGVPA
jgi:hypothetical protein